MEQRLYETTVVLDPQLDQTKIEAFVDQVQKTITEAGGSIRKVDHWGKKRMAYEIKKRQYGYYIYFLYESDGKIVAPMERTFRLNESVLRYLTVKLDKKAIRQMESGKKMEFKKFGRTPDRRGHSGSRSYSSGSTSSGPKSTQAPAETVATKEAPAEEKPAETEKPAEPASE